MSYLVAQYLHKCFVDLLELVEENRLGALLYAFLVVSLKTIQIVEVLLCLGQKEVFVGLERVCVYDRVELLWNLLAQDLSKYFSTACFLDQHDLER